MPKYYLFYTNLHVQHVEAATTADAERLARRIVENLGTKARLLSVRRDDVAGELVQVPDAIRSKKAKPRWRWPFFT